MGKPYIPFLSFVCVKKECHIKLGKGRKKKTSKKKTTKAESLTSAKFEYILFLTVKILEFLKFLLVFIQAP